MSELTSNDGHNFDMLDDGQQALDRAVAVSQMGLEVIAIGLDAQGLALTNSGCSRLCYAYMLMLYSMNKLVGMRLAHTLGGSMNSKNQSM